MRPTVMTVPFNPGDKLDDIIAEVKDLLDNVYEFKNKGEITIVIY